MLAKIISAMALTLLLTGSAPAFIPQPQGSFETELLAAQPAQPEQSSELAAAEQHNIYAGHSNSIQPQESSEAQLFAADTMLSEPRQFD